VRIGEAIRAAATGLARAIEADLRQLNRRFNPWYRQREIRNDLNALQGHVKACEILQEAHARDLEILRECVPAYIEIQGQVNGLEEKFVTLYELQSALETKHVGVGAQIVEFGNELEKVRLRLSAPAQESAPERPKTWRDQRRELEQKYATTHVNEEEKTDAGKSNAS